MSFAASSLRSIRSCTAAISTRSLARPAAARCPTRLSRLGVRCYSEAKATSEDTKQEGTSSEPRTETSELEAKLKATEAEVTDLTVSSMYLNLRGTLLTNTQGRLRYLQADFLNLQRNAAREKEQTRDFAITKFAGDLLETVDVPNNSPEERSPHRLCRNKQNTLCNQRRAHRLTSHLLLTRSIFPRTMQRTFKNYTPGVEMTQRLLLQTLFKYHVKPFDPTGDVFDPNHHEALYQAPVPNKEPGTVIDCQKIGYKIKDRVLRAAQVGVAQDTS